MKGIMKFSEMPSCGLFKDKPQMNYEMWEEVGKINDLLDCPYINNSDETYMCMDLREE